MFLIFWLYLTISAPNFRLIPLDRKTYYVTGFRGFIPFKFVNDYVKTRKVEIFEKSKLLHLRKIIKPLVVAGCHSGSPDKLVSTQTACGFSVNSVMKTLEFTEQPHTASAETVILVFK